MPTPEALENLRQTETHMKAAQQEHLAFIELPDRHFSAEERAENERLVGNISRTMAEYWKAFEAAANS